jgi:RNA polymerase-binding transcription factor DksA
VSELQALWATQEQEEAAVMAPAPAPTGPPARVPSPADDADRVERIVAELAGVEAALRRLDDDSYSRCEVCESPLDPDVLSADPIVTRCPEHAG